MTVTHETTPTTDTLVAEDYSKAMNFIGQNLLGALAQTLEKLPQPLRQHQLVSQGIAAFLANIIYKQFPTNPQLRQQMLEDVSKNVNLHLDAIPQVAE